MQPIFAAAKRELAQWVTRPDADSGLMRNLKPMISISLGGALVMTGITVGMIGLLNPSSKSSSPAMTLDCSSDQPERSITLIKQNGRSLTLSCD